MYRLSSNVLVQPSRVVVAHSVLIDPRQLVLVKQWEESFAGNRTKNSVRVTVLEHG